MAMQPDAPQLNIRLHIQPEVQDLANTARANTIGHEIFHDLTTHQEDYRVESVYTEEMGGDITFLIWLSPLIVIAGQALITAVADNVTNKIIDTSFDATKQIFQKIKNIKHKQEPVIVEVKSPTYEIKVQGSLADALDELDKTILPALVKREEQLAQHKDGQEIMAITIITITITVSSH